MSDNKYNSRQQRRQGTSTQKEKPSNTQKKSMMKKITALLLIFGLIGVTAGAIAVFAVISQSPELDPKALDTPASSKLFDKDGNEFGMMFRNEKRVKAPLDDIPQVMKDAVIATEDVRFYDHFGIDVRRIGGAAIANITGGFGSQGGSTITQQVIKNALLTNDKNMTRKIKEAYLAIKLEQRYSKDQIMEMYLNKIYFGESAYGIGTAAKTYFNKDIQDLELHEAALLAGLPKAPSTYSPFDNPEKAEKRRNVVLSQMAKYGFITEKQKQEAASIPVTDYVKESKPEEKQKSYETFKAQVIKEAAKMAGFEDPGEVYTAGLEIHTTLDPNAQNAVEEALYTDRIIKDENIQSGIVLTDTKTGAVRAIGSGRKNTASSFYATQMDSRQPGSSIKPILDYGPAIEHLKWPTYKKLSDEKLVVNGHEFHNWDRKHHGDVTMRRALYDSYNLPAIRTWQEVGPDKAKDFASKLGIEVDDKHYSPAYAIGGFNKSPSPMEMAAAYAAFGNKGVYNKPFTVTKIKFPDGRVIEHKAEPKAAMEEYTAYMVTDMLKDVITKGTAKGYVNLDFPVAGKTGTTNYPAEYGEEFKGKTRDAWFAGYSSNLSAAVWTGYNHSKDDDGNPQYLTKDTDDYSKLLFNDIMAKASADLDNTDWKRPDSVIEVPIEKGTDKRASEFTPKDEIVKELAVKGTDLPNVSEEYNKLEVPQGLKAEYDEKKKEAKLKWKYPKKFMEKGITFKILYSIDDGGFQELTTQKEMELVVQNMSPGANYKFAVVAVDEENGKESEPATVQVKTQEKEDDSGSPPFGDDEGDGNGNDNGNGGGPDQGEGPPPPPEGEDGNGGDGNGNPDEGGNPNEDGDDNGGDSGLPFGIGGFVPPSPYNKQAS
ncbi:transglycosylase domain-containing protein [Alkalihalobacillus sp. TS-13]|uniref:transglycosylase domain-containing protein n=1 Tax=Alkalihalobacillus sp. TS-13 TaxID=2842455 RepID=UPI001C878BD7|nr:PBP1A family penicillin-binding protein [Alkalihalobacillus sp. TS-13]